MSNYYYPFAFVPDAVGAGTFESLTGITGGTADGCPVPDFPIQKKIIDITQIQTYSIPNLEKRYMTAHKMPSYWTINYDFIEYSQMLYLREFYIYHKGRFDSFLFFDPDDYWLNGITNQFRVRFDSEFDVSRENKNFYVCTLSVIEVF